MNEKDVICPYCKHIQEDWNEQISMVDIVDENTVEIECEECKKRFNVSPNCSFSFDCEKLESDND